VLSTGVTARRHYLNVTCNNIINIYSNILQDEAVGQRSCEVRTTRVHRVTRAELLKSASDWQACHSSPETSPDCKSVNSMFSIIGSHADMSVPCRALSERGSVTGNASPLPSLANGRQRSVSGVPKLVRGTEVPQTSSTMSWNSNRRDITRRTDIQNVSDLHASTTVNLRTPFNRRDMEITAQSVYGKCDSPGHNLSNNESFQFQPQMSLASGRRNVLGSPHHSNEGNSSGIKDFKFLPQPVPHFMSDRTGMVAPKCEGGSTSRVLHFGSSSDSVSQASNPSQVPAIPGTSFDVSDLKITSEPVKHVAKPLQQTPTPSLKFGRGSALNSAGNLYALSETVSRSNECLTDVENSALEVLEGLDTSSLFDDF
jgi:hypothetical protein